nr:glycoside hydrolase family 38 C-terminal domain-containing protein [Tessaracoccus coleopterorum]
MAAAERALTTGERLDAFVGGPSRTAFFERGWGLVIESTAHDSVTGCGVDATADQVESRLKVAAQTADGAIDIALGSLGSAAPRGAGRVQPERLPPPRAGRARDRGRPGRAARQRAADRALPTVIGDETVSTSDLPKIIRRIHGQELFGKHIRRWTWEGDELVFTVADHTDGDFDLADFVAVLTAKAAEGERSFRVITQVPETCRVLVAAEADGISAVALDARAAAAPSRPVTAAGTALDNGLVRVEVAGDGGVTVTDLRSGATLADALSIVDDGDRGDSYNYGPVDGSVSTPESVEVVTVEEGPLRGRILIRRFYALPTGIDPADRARRSDETAPQLVDTVLELRADEPFVRVDVTLTNQIRDHRLRVLVPTLASGLTGSSSVGQYGATARGRAAEGGWGEFPLPTFPATRSITAGGVGVLLDKLVEYEIVDGIDGPDRIALTVLRSVGMMSVNVHPLRDEPAGSQLEVPGAQYLGRHTRLSFAIDLDTASQVEHADVFRFEPVTAPGRGGEPSAPACRCGRRARRARVAPTGARRRRGAVRQLRRHPGTPAGLRRGTWVPTDLNGAAVGGPVDPWSLEVGAGRIITLRKESQ